MEIIVVKRPQEPS